MSFADWAMLDGSHWARVRTTFIVDQGMCAFAGVAVKQPDGAVCEASSNVVDIFRIFAAHYVFGSITVEFFCTSLEIYQRDKVLTVSMN